MTDQHDTPDQYQINRVTNFPAFLTAGKFFSYEKAKKPPGRKRRFGAAGILNVAITNIALQAILASNAASILIATLISQSINTVLGYLIYGKLVFKAKGLRSHKPALRYISLMTVAWLLNSTIIKLGTYHGIQSNVAAACMVPILAILSYKVQKTWVFQK